MLSVWLKTSLFQERYRNPRLLMPRTDSPRPKRQSSGESFRVSVICFPLWERVKKGTGSVSAGRERTTASVGIGVPNVYFRIIGKPHFCRLMPLFYHERSGLKRKNRTGTKS